VEAAVSDPMDRVFALLERYRDQMQRGTAAWAVRWGNMALEVVTAAEGSRTHSPERGGRKIRLVVQADTPAARSIGVGWHDSF
jgi:hypothetical protein